MTDCQHPRARLRYVVGLSGDAVHTCETCGRRRMVTKEGVGPWLSPCIGFGEHDGLCMFPVVANDAGLWCVRCEHLRRETITEQMSQITKSFEGCQCEGDELFRWRGDPEWWSCAICDQRVRLITPEEQRELDERSATNRKPRQCGQRPDGGEQCPESYHEPR